MYLPERFSSKDEAAAFELMGEYPFATLITSTDEMPFISHLPLLADRGGRTLRGHMSRANPHWRLMEKNPAVRVIFQGAQTYITPSWYVSGRDVPTWNYSVVHAIGTVKLIESDAGLAVLLEELTRRLEGVGPNAWKFELPADLREPGTLTRAIVGFEIQIAELQGKFKLSQNRSEADQQAVIAGLATRSDDQSRGVREAMLRFGRKK